MPETYTKISSKAGLAPGSLVHVGTKKAGNAKVTLIHYDRDSLEEREILSLDECLSSSTKAGVTWIDVEGIHQLDTVEKIGKLYDLHPLTLEDIVNSEHRPKMEDYGDYIFIVLKTLSYSARTGKLDSAQISLVFKPSLVISFQEAETDIFEPLKERLRKGKGRLSKQGSDYLAYALMDSIIDGYFLLLDELGERIETIQEELVGNPAKETLQRIFSIRHDMTQLRRFIWPLRDFINLMLRGEIPLIEEQTRLYLRDLYDHTAHVVETIDTFRDTLSGMIDIYLSSISNKLNETMKVLTIIATIFIPLTFIAGVYGMNFENMPELKWPWGYAAVWLVMVGVAASMLTYFRRKNWI